MFFSPTLSALPRILCIGHIKHVISHIMHVNYHILDKNHVQVSHNILAVDKYILQRWVVSFWKLFLNGIFTFVIKFFFLFLINFLFSLFLMKFKKWSLCTEESSRDTFVGSKQRLLFYFYFFLPVSSFAISIIIHAFLHTLLRFSKVYT